MTKVFFNGGYIGHEGSGEVHERINFFRKSLELSNDDFILFGNIGIHNIKILNSSLNAKNATIVSNIFLIELNNSKVENINNANWIWLQNNSSLSNSSTNILEIVKNNNTIDGVVSAKEVIFFQASLTIAKDGILKVPDKNALNFSKINGEGKIFDEKTKAYYNTDGIALNDAKDTLAADIIKYNFAIAKEIKEQKEGYKNAYVDAGEQQDENVELLNTQMVNSDGLL